MKAKVQEKQTRAQLPVVIRYRAQDYETRYLDDPRALYVEEFQEQHPDDGFFAIIPNEASAAALAKWDVRRQRSALAWAAITFASLGWIVYRLFSFF